MSRHDIFIVYHFAVFSEIPCGRICGLHGPNSLRLVYSHLQCSVCDGKTLHSSFTADTPRLSKAAVMMVTILHFFPFWRRQWCPLWQCALLTLGAAMSRILMCLIPMGAAKLLRIWVWMLTVCAENVHSSSHTHTSRCLQPQRLLPCRDCSYWDYPNLPLFSCIKPHLLAQLYIIMSPIRSVLVAMQDMALFFLVVFFFFSCFFYKFQITVTSWLANDTWDCMTKL